MKKYEVREPKQKRSIEKKKRIVEAGYKLFCENGFYKTNTAEIAKEAGVSTGIVYNYFKDKKSIFLETIQLYMDLLTKPMYELITSLNPPVDLEEVVESMLTAFIAGHNMAKDAHEEMMYMSHSDEDVAKLFHDFDMQVADKLSCILIGLGINPDNLAEKIHIAKGLLENYCHALVYVKDSKINYDAMKKIVVRHVVDLFTK